MISAISYFDSDGPREEADVLEIIDLLLEQGADIDAANKWGHTALSEARNKGLNMVVDRLIAAGASDIGVRSSHGHVVTATVRALMECPS